MKKVSGRLRIPQQPGQARVGIDANGVFAIQKCGQVCA